MKKYLVIIIFVIFLLHTALSFLTKKMLYQQINPIQNTHNIPNIIFRSIKNLKVPKIILNKCHLKWIELNPTYNILWYSDKKQNKFMEKYYSGEVYTAYKSLKPGAYKTDLWRLCILYRFGGIYIDAYVEPYVSLKEMLKGCYNKKGKQFISVLDCNNIGIHNGIIISEKKHPFLKQAIEDILENVKNKYYGNSPLDTTGPVCLYKSLNKSLGLTNNKHKLAHNYHNELSYYLFEHRYGPYQHIYKNNIKIVSKYFSFLFYIYIKLINKNAYCKLWRNKDLFISSN
jgi:mannosyltransferase OCH1-like enzyme